MQRFRRRGALLLAVALVTVVWSTGEAAPAKKARYGTKVTAAVGQTVRFPDFELRPLGVRVVQPEHTVHLVYHDFELTSGPTKEVIYSGGTGDIGPQPFCFQGRSYELEIQISDKLGGLSEDQLVVWKVKTDPGCRRKQK